MTSRSISSVVGPVALLTAIPIWLGYAYLGAQPGSRIVRTSDLPLFLVVVGASCLLDAIVAIRALRGPVGRIGLMYLGIRALLSLGGLLIFTLPSYAIAIVALTRTTQASWRSGDPTQPHRYRATAEGWFGLLTPVWWSQNLMGATQLGSRGCAICGAAQNADIHAG